MLTARDIMTPHPLSVTVGAKVTEAARLMLEHHFNGLPVVDPGGPLRGVLSQSDLVMQHKKLSLPSYFVILDAIIPLGSPKKFEEEIKRMSAVTVEDAMSDAPRTVTPDTPLEDIASLMVDDKFYTLPVVDNGKLVGVVGKEDVLRTLLAGNDDATPLPRA